MTPPMKKLQELLARFGVRPGREPPPASDPGEEARYSERLSMERSHYDECLNVHELPDIFHYWSNRYLLPMFEPFGFTSPNDFFLKEIRRICTGHADETVSIVSIGAGNCDLETDIATVLLKDGISNFRFDCIEINSRMIERARARIEGSECAPRFRFLEEDFNHWRPPAGSYTVVMANQSLHHVLKLEHLFESVRIALAPGGQFLVSDMIGRNGHQRWPEALRLVETFWEELPQPYRYNQLLRRHEERYINHDCSSEGFEGVRAQDILPLLNEQFHFRLFLPYGNIVFVFVDRPFGHNFDATAEWDRDFIDRVHEADEVAMLDGRIKPTSMLAVLTAEPVEDLGLRDLRLTPEFCVRPVD